MLVFFLGVCVALGGCGLWCPAPPAVPEGEAEGEGALTEGTMEGEGSVEGTLQGEGEAEPEGSPAEGEQEGQLQEGEGEPHLPYLGDYGYAVVAEYPHDTEAFTQGLVMDNGVLYEGTGLAGRSSIREVDLQTGVVVRIHNLAWRFFGEGITVHNGRIIQLTWQNKTGFVYDRDSFEPIEDFAYSTEGWGLTHDGSRLIMSDGTSTLYFLDPLTFAQTGTLSVRDHGEPVTRLNELEYVGGELYANVWRTNRIARIALESGEVLGWIHLEGLLTEEEQSAADVLNGIAYDAEHDRLFVTGKLWPKLFEIRLVALK